MAICDKQVSKYIRQLLQYTFFENVHIYECGEFIDKNLSHILGKSICGNHFNEFESGGMIFDIFKKYHIIGGGFRQNYKRPCCGAIDRVRWIHMVLAKTTNIYTNSCRVLHFAPEEKIKEIIKYNEKCDYYNADIVEGRAEHIIDITNIPFQNNMFDYIIANHVLEHICDEEKAITELKRVIKEKGKLILSFPICKDKKTEEDITEQERIAKFGQSDHVRLYGIDYKERLEKRGIQCKCYSPEDVLSSEEIEKYGLIQDDICIVCNKY